MDFIINKDLQTFKVVHGSMQQTFKDVHGSLHPESISMISENLSILSIIIILSGNDISTYGGL